MARNIVRRSFSRSRAVRRESVWFFVTGSTNTITGGSGAVLIGGGFNAAALQLRPFTIVRVRGLLYLASDQAGAPEDQAINLGYSIVSDQAIAIGVTAVPTPTTDKGSDLFFVYQSLMSAGDSAAGAGVLGQGLQFDSRAMRKVEEGQDIAITVETELAALTDGVVVRHSARILVKLH